MTDKPKEPVLVFPRPKIDREKVLAAVKRAFERDEDLATLKDALAVADSCGLRAEFRGEYLGHRVLGCTVAEACYHARRAWDM